MLWLHDEFETDFTYNGIVLNNAYDSDIHWVLNTMYKLTFKYPTVDNDLYSFIEKGMIVKADEHDRTNLFRIKDIDISENDKCITVTAYQKNYDFSKRLVNNFGRLRVNCMSVLDEWYSNFLSSEKDFSYYSDINAINSFVSHNDDTDNKLRTSFELLGGIADTYSADIDMHDKQISLLERLGRDTEEVLTTAKNISEFVNTSNSDEIVTRIYASSTFKVGDKYDKKDLREQHRQQLKALRESQKEYSQGRNAVKKAQQMKDEIAKRYAKELAKNNKKVKRSGKVIKSYSQIESEVNAKYQARERKSQQRKAESQAIADRKKAEIESLKAQQKEELEALDEEITINLIVESPLINDYPFINEIAVSNNDLRTAEELEEWAMEYFTKQNIDKPKNSIKVTYEQLTEDINRGDTVILKYLKYGVDERIRVVETHYDPMLKKWKEFILGEKEGRLGSEVSNASSGAIAKANAYTDIITMDIERKVKERSENYDKLFKKNTDEINKKIEDGFEKAKASSEVITAKIDEDLEKKLAPIRNQVSATVENYNRQFQTTNLEISKNRVEATKQIQAVNLEISKNRVEATKQIQAANLEISKNRIEATKQIQALSDRVNNVQDISNNETVVELRGLVNGATSKVTELQDSITREFTAVKKKNEDGLSAVKAEFKKGVDGLTSKVSSLEEYKNQDGTRTESLKQWVQRDTANQLSRERTEINRIVDAKGYVKNTEFSSKFNDNAQGINRKLEALETYKNQDGVRTANLQIWTQNNTANQLTAARRSIESWVDDKGYATNSVVENKVQETANSISREIRNIRESIPTSVGGRNYITDSEKLQSKPHWGSNKWDETVDGDTIILTKKGGSDNTGFWFTLTDLVKTQFQNETLTWSIDVKASREMTLNTVGFETNGLRRVDISTQWKRMSHTFINKFTNYYAFVFYHPTTNFNNGDKIYIRLPKLEKGNVATDWTPAPEDNNAFVKNTEFSNKFTESARSINNQLSALETYKNQDGVRVANMQIWVQNNTANQLTAERRNIEKWVNDKGYATTSVVENKVQETANSFSREISNVKEVIKDKVLSNDNLLLGTKDFIPKHFAPASPWQRALVWENEIERYNDFAVKSTIYHFNGLWQDVAVEKGKTYEYGFFVKGSRYTNKIVFSPGWASDNAKRPLAEYNIRNTEFTLTTNWKFHSFRFTVTSSGWSQCRVEKIEENNGIKLSICGLYLREVKNNETSPLGWKPAFEDEQLSINELNTWKQTTTETLNTVSSGLNDTVRHSQLRIGADGIDFGSNKVFNGRNLASILSISPESIQAITNKLIITPANENLVKSEYRRNSSFTKDMQISEDFDIGKTTDFLVKGKARTNSYENRFRFAIKIIYKDGTSDFVTGVDSATYINGGMFSVPFKINEREKEIKNAYFTIDRYGTPIFDELSIVPQKSAELIVDGSIEGRQIKAETLETGHHKAGSITSEIIAANAVRAKHILIDDGLINNLVTHNAFISKLWAQDAFIRSLKTVKISTTQLDTDWLSAYTGDIGGFRIGKNPNQPGDFWLTGSNNFNCGLNPGHNIGTRGAQIWAAWGYNWNQAGPNAWWVDGQGRMNCKSSATFYGGLHVYNARLDTHGQDIQGDANSAGAKTTVIWWSQINRVKSSVSDKRFKTNIKPTKVKAVDLLNKIEMVEFNWKKDNKFEKIGAIAQQVQSVEESLVVKDMDSKQSHSDYLRISYYDAIPYLIKAVQELSEENNKLKNKLEELING